MLIYRYYDLPIIYGLIQQVVTLLSKHLGNQKAIIKQILMMSFMDLFQNLNPKQVIGTLAVSLENRNSRIREEVYKTN